MHTPPLAIGQGEELRAKVFANLFRGWEGVGGILYITDRRIRFESHGWNVQVGPCEIRLDEIASVRPCNNFGVIPNGTETGTQLVFPGPVNTSCVPVSVPVNTSCVPVSFPSCVPVSFPCQY